MSATAHRMRCSLGSAATTLPLSILAVLFLSCYEPGAVREESSPRLKDQCEQQIERLSSPDERVRMIAISELQQIGDQRAVEPLIACLSSDPSPAVRLEATRVLGVISNSMKIKPLVANAIKPLIVTLKSGNMEERRMAEQRFRRLSGRPRQDKDL